MPSPFPGMDPYLEDPDLWPDVHANLIAQVQAELNRQIAPRYVARIEQRVFVADETDPGRDVIGPDVRVLGGRPRGNRGRAAAAAAATSASGGTATVDAIEPVAVTSEYEQELRQSFIRVIDVRDRSVVAVIEVLSPSNKIAGSEGQESFREKRREVMQSAAHWVEIDLLRVGVRLAVPEPLPPHDYLVHVSWARQSGRRRAKVWPIPITHRLPTVPVPLRHGDADAQLDLQAVLDQAYERGAYDVDVDYAADPVPALTGEAASWARATADKAGVPD